MTMPDMIPVTVDSIRANLMGPQRIIVLRERNGERLLVIWVGPFEADAIKIALHGIETARPLTHALLKHVMRRLGATPRRVEIIALKDDIFYSFIVAEYQNEEIRIDARPSDAIALALYAHIPILVSEEVMEEAGFVPEAAIDETALAEQMLDDLLRTEITPEEKTPSADETSEDRLSIFEDFLEALDDEDEEDQGKEA